MEQGYYQCHRCGGTGMIRVKRRYNGLPRRLTCPVCWGKGKLDWVENIVGRSHPFENMTLPFGRSKYPGIIAKELVSVQPMESPKIVYAYKEKK